MQQSAQVAGYFHRTADEFDALYDQTGLKSRLNRWLRRGLYDRVALTVAELAAMKEPTVLDVGCGSARNAVIFIKQGGAKHLTGVDFSERMIELARATVEANDVADRAEFILQDVLEYRPAEKFDAVVAMGVFDYVDEPGPFLRALKELSRGKVLASFPGHELVRTTLRRIRYDMRGCPLHFYTKESLEQAARDAGFTSFRVIPYASSGLFLSADA
ncbi:MAG TPA: class I SAM-dependent methyltransferase [Longimicrobiales bacterium]|nr:class I SAM-dependent methyltransferase [Longimicrobiales bacterium]